MSQYHFLSGLRSPVDRPDRNLRLSVIVFPAAAQMMEQNSLLQCYRRDRRQLLEFLLSSGMLKEIRTPSGPTTSLSDIDFDNLSADYIIGCLQSGGIVDLSEARRKYESELAYPVMIHSGFRDSYFLTSDPNFSGHPPRRVPPTTILYQSTHNTSTREPYPYNVKNVEAFSNDYTFTNYIESVSSAGPVSNSDILQLGLPILKTGLLDDDLVESAYEVLLASMSFCGFEVSTTDDRKKEKSSKVLSGLRSKRDKTQSQTQPSEKQLQLLHLIRLQMQISERMDICIRRNMAQLATRRMDAQFDLPNISLGLLIGVFKSDFPTEKTYMQWKIRQANILEELLSVCSDLSTTECLSVKGYLEKIRNTKEWDEVMSPSQRVEILSSIRQVVSKLSSVPGQFGIQSETCYWAAAYHLHFRIYEKLLCGVFDVLDEGQLIEEVDEFLQFIKLTWPILGITWKMHHALYGWVLFKQVSLLKFVGTEEGMLLERAVVELRTLLSVEETDEREEQYISTLVCSTKRSSTKTKLNLVQTIFLSINTWCDHRLQDYHLHFSQKPSDFRRVMALASAVGVLPSASDDYTKTKSVKLIPLNEVAGRKIREYIEKSVEAVFKRVVNASVELKVDRMHHLSLLAKELSLVADRELKIFSPELLKWCPECLMISSKLLHQSYGEKLAPFLERVSCLSEEARSVLPAAYMLDHKLAQLYTSAIDKTTLIQISDQHWNHYQIEKVSLGIILDWLIGQHAHILEWTGRAFDLEDWEPLSFHQRQAASVIEVFRIIEETVDQLFAMNIPMDIIHLQGLLSLVFHSLDIYLQRLLSQLVEKNHLYPPDPPLTRYAEATIPVIKKRLHQDKVLDENVLKKLKDLTIPKLCVKLNTLQFIHKQIGLLEDDIRKSWAQVPPLLNQYCAKEPVGSLDNDSGTNEAVDGLFDATFNCIRDSATDIMKRVSSLIGARIIFWDLRDTFLFQLYRGSVASARMDSFILQVDDVLDNVCGLIDDTVRDFVVLNVCQASLEGFCWVLLNGGPSRAFSDSDITMIQEDLATLKEFFIANGEGLPRSLVDQEAKSAGQIIELFSLQPETVIQMLMAASESMSTQLDPHKEDRVEEHAYTLIRVLCHKKDREASKFLRTHYELPMSSDYDDATSREASSGSPLLTDLLNRNTSFHWTKGGQSSFRSMKKKLQVATSEIRNMGR